MTPQMYTEFTRSCAIYPDEVAITYLALGLASEAGEVAGKIKKALRGDYGEGTDEGVNVEARRLLLKELGDVLWYLTRLADEMGVTLEDLMFINASELADRSMRGVIMGDGDDR